MHGWGVLIAWTVSFALLTMALLGLMGVGVLILPFAGIAFLFTARRGRLWPEGAIGALLGVALVLLWGAFANRDYIPCLPENNRMVLSRGGRWHCGGVDPVPLLLAGLAVLKIGLLACIAWARGGRRSG